MGQIAVNSIVAAAGYLLVGIGFSLIYTSARFFHFAHGIVLTVGAYTVFALNVRAGFPLWMSIVGGAVASTLLGTAMECAVYRPLRIRNASAAVLLLASLGIYVALQASLSLVFGSGTQTFRAGNVPSSLVLIGTRITVPQIAMVIMSAACGLLTWLLLKMAPIGKMIRAVANDPELAETHGLDRDRVVMVAFFVGSALAGVAAVLLGYDTDINPTMGFRALLMGMVAVIIGGVGSIPGTALGAVFLGLVQHFTAWWISSMWQDAIVFVILILFLLVRPQGFLGTPLKSASV